MHYQLNEEDIQAIEYLKKELLAKAKIDIDTKNGVTSLKEWVDMQLGINHERFDIDKYDRETIEEITLRKLFGKVNRGNLAKRTLVILARSLGYYNWENYKDVLATRIARGNVFDPDEVDVKRLHPKETLILGWFNSGRFCEVEYLGNNSFRVLRSEGMDIKYPKEFVALKFSVIDNLFEWDVEVNYAKDSVSNVFRKLNNGYGLSPLKEICYTNSSGTVSSIEE